ncbi:MAG: ABC transporter ATP-binding protein [Bryobacterales bacterium]|nr:ABC transporter ATP-binding protein [Bryobacterales bacterium]
MRAFAPHTHETRGISPEREAIYSLRGVGMRYGESTVLRDVTLDLHAREAIAIVGPNGAGKSTLLQILAGLLPGHLGSCRLNDVEVNRWPRRDFARAVGFIPQNVQMEFPFTVEEVVAMGRHAHATGIFESAEDWAAVEDAMHQADCFAFRHRDFRSLSGGERQRAILASALAQRPCILLLDEPTTWLDLRHQVEIHRVLNRLRDEGLLVVMVTHDLNLAAGFSDRVLVLEEGRLAADGKPESIFTGDLIKRIFHVEATIHREAGERPWMLYGR